MEDTEVVAQEAQVESETTSPSTSETQTTPEVENSEVATSAQPTEEVKQPRANQRIQELSKRAKEAEERAEYWSNLAQQPQPVAPQQPEDDSELTTVDQVADAVMRKQNEQKQKENYVVATQQVQRDAIETLAAHPELESDDELANLVVLTAQSQGITLKAAAEKIKSRLKTEQKKAEQKVVAEQASRTGVTSPRGEKVSTGEPTKPNLSTMTEMDKEANWGQILENYNQ